MTAPPPFATQLRVGRDPIIITEPGPGVLTVRVQASDIWETVQVIASGDTPIAEVKRRVVERLFPNQSVDDFVLKLRGWEMLDERESLASAGVANGSILLLAVRRRRPVR